MQLGSWTLRSWAASVQLLLPRYPTYLLLSWSLSEWVTSFCYFKWLNKFDSFVPALAPSLHLAPSPGYHSLLCLIKDSTMYISFNWRFLNWGQSRYCSPPNTSQAARTKRNVTLWKICRWSHMFWLPESEFGCTSTGFWMFLASTIKHQFSHFLKCPEAMKYFNLVILTNEWRGKTDTAGHKVLLV